MSNQKPTHIASLKNHYGIALEEIRIERSISDMMHLLRSVESEKKTHYLLNEIAHRERQLLSIRKQRKEE